MRPRLRAHPGSRQPATVRGIVEQFLGESEQPTAEDVVIDKTYPLDCAAAAVAHMLGHHARGKVAITVP